LGANGKNMGKRKEMDMEERDQERGFESFGDLAGTPMYDLITLIAHAKTDPEHVGPFTLKGIKKFAGEIRKKYVITRDQDKALMIGDEFLDSPYFDFIAKVWDFTDGDPRNIEFANQLVEAGFKVTKVEDASKV